MKPEVETYLNQIDVPEKKEAFIKLRNIIINSLPNGFDETIQYKMITYVVPLQTYPKGYHCTANTPLPFISIASQKNFIAFYHMGIYANENLKNWFIQEYESLKIGKLDMGKSCIRFKKTNQIPYKLISELASKITPEEWVMLYEQSYRTI